MPVRVGLWIGAASLVFMAGVTLVDVICSKIFHSPLAGSYEFVALAQLVAIALAGADALVSGRHVQVEMFVAKLSPALRRVVVAVVAFFGLLLFATMTWEGFLYGLSLQEAKEVSGTVKVPLFPFAYILGFSGLLLFLLHAQQLFQSFGRRE